MDIKLTEDGDLDLGSDISLKLTDKKEQVVRQRVMIVLGVNRGEWLYDTSFGVPWVRNQYNNFSILEKLPRAVIDGEIKRAITSRDGVESIVSYQYNDNNRKSNVTCSIKNDSGDIVKIEQYIAGN